MEKITKREVVSRLISGYYLNSQGEYNNAILRKDLSEINFDLSNVRFAGIKTFAGADFRGVNFDDSIFVGFSSRRFKGIKVEAASFNHVNGFSREVLKALKTAAMTKTARKKIIQERKQSKDLAAKARAAALEHRTPKEKVNAYRKAMGHHPIH